MKFLALDVGEKRIGVARGDSNTRIAVPVGFIERTGLEWQKIAQMVKLNHISEFVLGLPRSNEGNETAQSQYVRAFADTLADKIPGVEIHFQDETLTSIVAEERLKARGKPYQKGDIDAESAVLILQDFLERLPSSSQKRQAAAEISQIAGGNNNITPNNAHSPIANPDSSHDPGISSSPNHDLGQDFNLTTDINQDTEGAKNMKKAKKSKKKHTKAIIWTVVILLILAAAGTAGGFYLYNRYQERLAYQEYLAEQEAKLAEDSVFTFTVLPGETIYDIRDNLIKVGYDTKEVDAALAADYDYDFLAERPADATLEGYLFGETKEFYKDTPVTEVIDFYLSEMDKTIKDNNLETAFAKQGLSLHEGITLASVVQKEAPTPEMPTVAQVFLTRLEEGIPLGSDVTVSYALDTLDPDRDSHSDNQTALGVDSCYNTRLYQGLPCGPISNPGLSALLAVANPSDTSYLYFLTGDDQLMYYSYTEAEHEQNAAEHCQDLCQISL